MSSEDLRSSLDQLRASAAQMNVLSDAVNESFKLVEHFLAHECSLGIEAWVTTPSRGLFPYELGFCKLEKGTWRLCIRHVAIPSPNALTELANPLSAPLTLSDARPKSETLKAWDQFSRDVKLLVVPALPDLVNEIRQTVQGRITETEKALARIKRALPSSNGK